MTDLATLEMFKYPGEKTCDAPDSNMFINSSWVDPYMLAIFKINGLPLEKALWDKWTNFLQWIKEYNTIQILGQNVYKGETKGIESWINKENANLDPGGFNLLSSYSPERVQEYAKTLFNIIKSIHGSYENKVPLSFQIDYNTIEVFLNDEDSKKNKLVTFPEDCKKGLIPWNETYLRDCGKNVSGDLDTIVISYERKDNKNIETPMYIKRNNDTLLLTSLVTTELNKKHVYVLNPCTAKWFKWTFDTINGDVPVGEQLESVPQDIGNNAIFWIYTSIKVLSHDYGKIQTYINNIHTSPEETLRKIAEVSVETARLIKKGSESNTELKKQLTDAAGKVIDPSKLQSEQLSSSTSTTLQAQQGTLSSTLPQAQQGTLNKDDSNIRNLISILKGLCEKLRRIYVNLSQEDKQIVEGCCDSLLTRIDSVQSLTEHDIEELNKCINSLESIIRKHETVAPPPASMDIYQSTTTTTSTTPTTTTPSIDEDNESQSYDDLMDKIAKNPLNNVLSLTSTPKVIEVTSDEQCLLKQQPLILQEGIKVFTRDKGVLASIKRVLNIGSTTSVVGVYQVSIHRLANTEVTSIDAPVGTLVYCYNKTEPNPHIVATYLKIGKSGDNRFIKLSEISRSVPRYAQPSSEPQHLVVSGVGQFILSGILFQ